MTEFSDSHIPSHYAYPITCVSYNIVRTTGANIKHQFLKFNKRYASKSILVLDRISSIWIERLEKCLGLILNGGHLQSPYNQYTR